MGEADRGRAEGHYQEVWEGGAWAKVKAKAKCKDLAGHAVKDLTAGCAFGEVIGLGDRFSAKIS